MCVTLDNTDSHRLSTVRFWLVTGPSWLKCIRLLLLIYLAFIHLQNLDGLLFEAVHGWLGRHQT